MDRRLATSGRRSGSYPPSLPRPAGFGCTGGIYDPPTDTIYLNRTSMEQDGLEFLKIVLAHELVHAGQFRNTPGLPAYALDYSRRSLGIIPDSADAPSFKDRRQYMVELEGYATYIERDFIRKEHYRMAISDYHSSAADTIELIVAALASQALGYSLPEQSPDASVEDKFKQYEEGVKLYRSRATPERPARWEVQVSSLPGGASFG